MKKIGIITLYRDNFGSILQAYSTYNFFINMGYEVVLLQEIYSRSLIEKIKKISKIIWRCIRFPNYFIDRIKIRKTMKQEINLLSQTSRDKMNRFVNAVFKIEIVNQNDINLLNSRFDFFVTGSDQVWNGYDAFKYLTFADREKKIALAPSFGCSEIKDYFRKEVKCALEGFELISSREETGIELIKQLTGMDAFRLPDPTLLLTKREWEEFAIKGIRKENYILLHFLNKPTVLAIEIINEYLEKHDYVAYCICNRYDEYNKLRNYEFLDIDPYDYVSLINNACFVFTDSFHSTLFSLNLETQFFTFERQYFHGNPQRSRIIDLLNRVGMSERFMVKDTRQNELGYWDSDKLFKEERENIKNYLERALGR